MKFFEVKQSRDCSYKNLKYPCNLILRNWSTHFVTSRLYYYIQQSSRTFIKLCLFLLFSQFISWNNQNTRQFLRTEEAERGGLKLLNHNSFYYNSVELKMALVCCALWISSNLSWDAAPDGVRTLQYNNLKVHSSKSFQAIRSNCYWNRARAWG